MQIRLLQFAAGAGAHVPLGSVKDRLAVQCRATGWAASGVTREQHEHLLGGRASQTSWSGNLKMGCAVIGLECFCGQQRQLSWAQCTHLANGKPKYSLMMGSSGARILAMMGNWSMKNLPAARRQVAAQNKPDYEGSVTSRLSCLFCHTAGFPFSMDFACCQSTDLQDSISRLLRAGMLTQDLNV